MTGHLSLTPPSVVHSETRPVDASGKGRVASLSQADQRGLADPLLRSFNAQDMLVAVFRLAVADASGEPADDDRGETRWRSDACSFIASDWAVELADLGQLPIAEIRRQLGLTAARLTTRRPSKGLRQSVVTGGGRR